MGATRTHTPAHTTPDGGSATLGLRPRCARPTASDTEIVVLAAAQAT